MMSRPKSDRLEKLDRFLRIVEGPFPSEMDFVHGEKRLPQTFQVGGRIRDQIAGSADMLSRIYHLGR